MKHFYLYNNLSADHYWEVLQPYVKKGIVELFDVPFSSYEYNDNGNTHFFVQTVCYNHAMSLASSFNAWLAIIDSDEFICPVIDPDLPTALKRYDYAGGLAVYWQIYGTSNVKDLKPGELQIEKLLYKEPNPKDGLFKSIVKPELAHSVDPHWSPMINDNIPMVLPNHQRFSHTPGFSALPIDVIRINHYTFRTESYYYAFKKPRKARWGFIVNEEFERQMLDSYNKEYDPIMLRFVPELKKRIKKIKK